MKKRIFLFIVVGIIISLLIVTAVSARGVVRGTAQDPSYPVVIGDIDYLGTPAGYHFWFTPTSNLGRYIAGHSYHNVYQLEVDSLDGWCGKATVPNREPYNIVGIVGQSYFYKIIDMTSGGNICP